MKINTLFLIGIICLVCGLLISSWQESYNLETFFYGMSTAFMLVSFGEEE